MTRDEWCHAAVHRTPVLVAMEGIPDAPATLIGWRSARRIHVRYQSGKTAVVRPERVTFQQVNTSMRGAADAARPPVATNEQTASTREKASR